MTAKSTKKVFHKQKKSNRIGLFTTRLFDKSTFTRKNLSKNVSPIRPHVFIHVDPKTFRLIRKSLKKTETQRPSYQEIMASKVTPLIHASKRCYFFFKLL